MVPLDVQLGHPPQQSAIDPPPPPSSIDPSVSHFGSQTKSSYFASTHNHEDDAHSSSTYSTNYLLYHIHTARSPPQGKIILPGQPEMVCAGGFTVWVSDNSASMHMTVSPLLWIFRLF